VTEQVRDGSGDYGYDMAHEDVRGGRAPADRGGQEHRTPSPAPGNPDPGEDLGYDEAHSF
jgi:hypothetical protein